jgi:transposase-like protein
MSNERKHHSPEEKVAILRRHLIDKIPVSTLCDEHDLHPTVFYRRLKQFFENGAAACGLATQTNEKLAFWWFDATDHRPARPLRGMHVKSRGTVQGIRGSETAGTRGEMRDIAQFLSAPHSA